MKVSLYVREHGTRRCELATHKKIYPMGTIFVLRFGAKWETLKGDHTYQTAKTEAMRKEIDLFTGAAAKLAPKPIPKPKPINPATLDNFIDKYLTSGKAAEEGWSKHTLGCYTLSLRLFRESCTKLFLHEIDGDDLKKFKVFLRQQKTSVPLFCGEAHGGRYRAAAAKAVRYPNSFRHSRLKNLPKTGMRWPPFSRTNSHEMRQARHLNSSVPCFLP
jgi:hypothetical protein